jgi:hypothetical protein
MQPRVSGVCLPLAGVKFAQSDAAAADGREHLARAGPGAALDRAAEGRRGQPSTAQHTNHQVPPGAAGCEDAEASASCQTRSAGLPACQRVRVFPTVRSCW